MNPFIIWRCSKESPAPSTRHGPSSSGSCRRASGRCADASRSTRDEAAPKSSSRYCDSSSDYSMRDLRIAVEKAAVMLSVNADVVELLIRRDHETPVELFSLDGHAHLRSVSLDAVDLGAYRSLTAVDS